MLRRVALLGLVAPAAALVSATGAAAAIGLTANNVSFSVTLDGADQTPPFSFGMSATGTSGPFSITMSATPFTSSPGSLGFPTLTGITTGACSGGGCINAVNTVTGYPMAINGTAQKIYSTLTAKGTIPLTANMTVSLPGNAFAGAYTSTFTLTIASSP